MIPHWIIERKRDGQVLSDVEIRGFIEGFTSGTIPDYQMSALAMAIFFQGMNAAETTVLTDAMMRSGDCLDLSSLGIPTVDKHSTGGVGDKISLILAPLAASCGVGVPMLSGRGLGITGGTLDKLEAIPGYRTDLSPDRFLDVLRRCGCSITGQSERLAPADRKLYALRDVTATVPSIPLIAASIMSKKLAEGTDHLILDIKCGNGAFMSDLPQARHLGEILTMIGRHMGRGVRALITDMNQPLGRRVGNRLEVCEAVEVLQGRGPEDVRELTMALGVEMLLLAGIAPDAVDARARLEDRLGSGHAFETFKKMVILHGGDARALDDCSLMPDAPVLIPVPSPGEGTVRHVNAGAIGRVAQLLGAGRSRISDRVDPRVGVSGLVKIGERVKPGQPLMTLHAATPALSDEVLLRASQAVSLTDEDIKPPARVIETLKEESTPHE